MEEETLAWEIFNNLSGNLQLTLDALTMAVDYADSHMPKPAITLFPAPKQQAPPFFLVEVDDCRA